MDVQFSAKTEAQLKQFAESEGKDAGQLVEETMARVLKRREQFLESVERGIDAADRGELIDDDDVRAWLEMRERT